MAHVNVVINGRTFRMACEDGQEQRLIDLAIEVDGRIEKMRKDFGQIGDTRLIVMATVQLADEFVDLRKRVEMLEEEIGELRGVGAAASDHAQQTQAAIVAAFNSAAERIETVTRSLNASLVGNPGGEIGIG
jgi:cell division protein ZapA